MPPITASVAINCVGEAKTDKGTLIPYDLALWCTGMRPDASYMKPHLLHLLDDKGEDRIR